MVQEQKRRTPREKQTEQAKAPAPNPETTKKGEELRKGIDELLDEIDKVLDENAGEFVKNYVQRGGE